MWENISFVFARKSRVHWTIVNKKRSRYEIWDKNGSVTCGKTFLFGVRETHLEDRTVWHCLRAEEGADLLAVPRERLGLDGMLEQLAEEVSVRDERNSTVLTEAQLSGGRGGVGAG